MFYADKPIENEQDDLLNRAMFSKQLSNAILSYKQTDNYTISLCGAWGCGKTSILNMVVRFIEESSNDILQEERPIIIKFNPWNYSNQDQLISQFFQTILFELKKGKGNEKLKNIGDALQKYSAIMDYTTYIPVVGKYLEPVKSILSNFGEQLSDKSQENENLVNIKNMVTNALKNQMQKLIVIIDDIDRLNNDQIRLIFQLVNSLAGFPNMIYLLSFDKNVVIRALEDEQKCNGEDYLEKIIQVPFDIPVAKMSLVHKVFLEKANKVLEDIPCESIKNEYWNSIFANCISPFIKNIRDVNRIINVFRFKYGLIHDETNCIDLLAVTTLQICAPNILVWIHENIYTLSGSAQAVGGITGIKQKENKDMYLSEFKEIYPDNPNVMLNVIKALFPKFSWQIGGYTNIHNSNNELKREQRLACSERADIYFNLSLEDVKISKKQILVSINTFDQEEMHLYISELIKNGTLYEYLQEIRAYINDIPEERLSLFFYEFIDIQAMETTYESGELSVIGATYLCKECSWDILKRLDNEKRLSLLLSAIGKIDNKSLSILVGMVLDIERAWGKIGDSIDYTYRIVDEIHMVEIEKEIIKQIKAVSEKSNLLDNVNFINIWRLWSKLEYESFSNYITKSFESPQNVPKYLYITPIKWTVNDTTGWKFEEDSFSDVITKDLAYEKIMSLKGTKEFASLNIRFKEITIAYFLWYNSDGDVYDKVSRENVSELLPQWEEN